MNWWLMVFGLVDKWGPDVIALAEKLWKLAAAGQKPTQADWDELTAIGAKTATSKMTENLIKAGIDLSSPQAIALLALTKT